MKAMTVSELTFVIVVAILLLIFSALLVFAWICLNKLGPLWSSRVGVQASSSSNMSPDQSSFEETTSTTSEFLEPPVFFITSGLMPPSDQAFKLVTSPPAYEDVCQSLPSYSQITIDQGDVDNDCVTDPTHSGFTQSVIPNGNISSVSCSPGEANQQNNGICPVGS